MNYTSPHYDGKHFQNPVPTEVMASGAMFSILKEYLKKHPNRYPDKTPGPFPVDVPLLHNLQPHTLRITWLGHSTTLIEVDGKRFLTDPVWYQRVSPFTWLGPKRFFDVPVSMTDLPPVDYILLSHDHYDHLDKNAMLYFTRIGINVICLPGVEKWLLNWGVNKNLITVIDWWQSTVIDNNFVVTAAPTRHFSGRGLRDRFTTLWGSFAITTPNYNIYYGADSGYYNGFTQIGEKLGPFDVTLLEIGAYNERWADIHMGPEKAVQAHTDLKGHYLLPIHWGTFSLAFHPWTEPAERVIKAAQKQQVPLLLPAPGQTWNIKDGPVNSGWWKNSEKE